MISGRTTLSVDFGLLTIMERLIIAAVWRYITVESATISLMELTSVRVLQMLLYTIVASVTMVMMVLQCGIMIIKEPMMSQTTPLLTTLLSLFGVLEVLLYMVVMGIRSTITTLLICLCQLVYTWMTSLMVLNSRIRRTSASIITSLYVVVRMMIAGMRILQPLMSEVVCVT